MGEIRPASWLGDLYKDTSLVFETLPVVPTSHNSCAHLPKRRWLCLPYSWAKCQRLSIKDQLSIGVRGFDLRLRLPKVVDLKKGLPSINIVHFFESSYTLARVFTEMLDFLEKHPKESIFILIKAEWRTRFRWSVEAINLLWKRIAELPRLLKSSSLRGKDPSKWTFQDIRGKMIMVPDDAIYANYTSQHDTEILSPTFFNKCINYNADSISTAMQNISAHFGKSGESGYKWVETNVVVACFPPWWVARRMHKFLDAFVQKDVKSDQERCFGIFLIDFCDSALVKKIISFCSSAKFDDEAIRLQF
eukprot:g6238.t1